MYKPAADRYEKMTYRRCGRSGVLLPGISLGLWHNFGNITPFTDQRALLRTAFDLGITHFDLANNYGPPYGEAERNFGLHMDADTGTSCSFPPRPGMTCGPGLTETAAAGST